MQQKKIVLIDGHAIIHRAFHAVPEDLSTSAGEPVNATFGFTSMLMKALLEEKPDYIAVTFDRPVPTFRHEQYTPYKAHRPTLPDNMRPQFGRIREVVQAFGLQIYEKDGFEADDVLGTLSVQASAQGVATTIYTGDMDTLQLVNDHVLVKVAKRGISEITEYNTSEVQTRYGFAPEKLPDFKGLVGDKSDNIPGVPGIGEKTAARLINEYGGLEGILAHVDQLKPKEKKLLTEGAEQARQSKYLATIVLDVPIQLQLDACKLTHVDTEKVISLFRQLEFRTLIERALSLFRQLGLAPASAAAAPEAQPAEQDVTESLSDAENLLFKDPLGVVPILAPPLPPEGDGTGSAPTAATANPALVAAKTLQGQSPATGEDALTQLSLFAVDEPHQEPVRRLHLPGLATTPAPLFLEDRSIPQTSTMIIDTEDALRVLVQSLYKAGSFAFDTETTSEDPRKAELVGLSLSMAPKEAYYIPVGHKTTPDGQEPGPQLELGYVINQLRPVLENATVRKYMHNAKYDLAILKSRGVEIRGLALDTMLGAYLTEPGRRGLGLKDQAFQRLGVVMTPISELIGSGSKMISMAQVPIRKAADYAGSDADMTLRLVEPIQAELQRHNLVQLYKNIEEPLIPVLMQMELYGVALDGDFLREFGEKLDEQLHELEHNIYESVGHRFNVNSNQQLGEVLF
ncbi:MAG: hypothetical protein J2P37_27940, partial [Ktedonobacteraceae bacterium]|nr:hypothetical protein [Ktedonobacteraceae bacterium]